MTEYELAELAAKVEWEGGLCWAVYDYGITHKDVPSILKDDWKKLEDMKDTVLKIERILEMALEPHENKDEG